MNTDLRKKAKKDFEKYFFELMYNAYIGILDLSQQKEEESIWCQNQIIILRSFSQNIC